MPRRNTQRTSVKMAEILKYVYMYNPVLNPYLYII